MAESPYQVTGSVVDINGNGVPGAKVSLLNRGVLALTDGDNPVYTASSGPDIGTYKFTMSQLCSEYQIIAEKDGRQRSTFLQVTGNYSSYTAKKIAFLDYTSPVVGPAQASTPTPTAVATPVPSPSASPTTAPTETTNATAAPSTATGTPTADSTPVPSPGLSFTFIPALMVICLIALRTRN